jgi:hypothetical protein
MAERQVPGLRRFTTIVYKKNGYPLDHDTYSVTYSK